MLLHPATGLMVYQTDGTDGFYYYNDTAWNSLNGNTTGDNLGNHTASQDLNISNKNVTNVDSITARKANL